MYGEDFHPIMKMARNCDILQRQADKMMEMVVDMDLEEANRPKVEDINKAICTANAEWYRIAEYTEPKLKAVEIDLNATLSDLTESELNRRILQLSQKIASDDESES